jgi:hypothetical protein
MMLESSSYDVLVSSPLRPHSQHAGHEKHARLLLKNALVVMLDGKGYGVRE